MMHGVRWNPVRLGEMIPPTSDYPYAHYGICALLSVLYILHHFIQCKLQYA